MNYYETLYIVHPALESGRLKDIILSIEKMIESKDIKILSTDVWGKKKLAYLIDKQQYGSYVLVQLHSNGSNINKINSERFCIIFELFFSFSACMVYLPSTKRAIVFKVTMHRPAEPEKLVIHLSLLSFSEINSP